MIETYLFLGGPLDGQRIEVDPSIGKWYWYEPRDKPLGQVLYEKREDTGRSHRKSVYAVSGWTWADIYGRLIDGYQAVPR